jgi:hypothetical protein
MRIVIGILLMTAFVMILWALIARYAGTWGVPYFSFQTERGTTCKNDFTGYTCHQMTLADLEFYGEVDLPSNTRVLDSTYRSTHDYQLDARLQVPRASAAAALQGLNASFGRCIPGHISPLSTNGVTGVCVMANEAAVTGQAETGSRLYTVGTGLRRDGTRVIAMSVKSR